MRIRIIASRHSAFYSPLLAAAASLRDEGHDIPYGVLAPGQRTHVLLRDGEVDIMQSAVSSNWPLIEKQIEPLPVHFAQINCRDGFFLAGRRPEPAFWWEDLEGRALLADHGLQPLTMLKYALKHNGVDWAAIHVVDGGAPQQSAAAFRDGAADYVHQQGPIVAGGEFVASVGASMPPVAFSSLCCARSYLETDAFRLFLAAFERAKDWVRTAPAGEIARRLAEFFPVVSTEVLADAVSRYQRLGCWDGGVGIPRDLYEQALNVFESAGGIARRHPYEEVVSTEPHSDRSADIGSIRDARSAGK